MGKYIFLAFIIIILQSCETSTRIVHSWRDPDVVIDTAKTTRFVVAALLKNESVRKRTEDLMAFYYPKKAVSSYKELGTALLRGNIAFYDQKLKSEGFDAVVVMALAKKDKNTKYIPGQYPDYYNNWVEYYNHAWPEYADAGAFRVRKTYYVEVNIYSLIRNKLVWSGVTSTLNPSGTDELFDNVINIVNEKMKKEGFLH